MKKLSSFLSCLLVFSMFIGLLAFTTSCKSEGEKLASEAIVLLNKEDLDGLINMKSRLEKLSPEEQKKAEAYLKKHEPQYEEKAKKMLMKKFGVSL